MNQPLRFDRGTSPMSPIGTKRPISDVRYSVAIEGKADTICSFELYRG